MNLPAPASLIPLRILAIAIFCLFCKLPATAESIPVANSSVMTGTIVIPGINFPANGMPGFVESVTIPLKRYGRLFLIEAKVDDEDGNFIFDSGSSQFVLNSTYFRKYMKIEGDEGGGVTGSAGPVSRTRVKKLMVSGLEYDNIMADVLDLGHIENRRNVKVLGLFGLSLIKDLEIVIDISHNQLRLYRIDKAGNRLNRYEIIAKADVTQKVQEYHNLCLVDVTIGGKVLNFCLDTAAESDVLSSTSPKKVMNTVTILRRSGLVGVGHAGADVLLAQLNDVVIGEHKIPEMQAIITNLDALAASYGIAIDGLLGYDFLEKGEVCINLVKKELRINFRKEDKK